ncbi:MAG: exopolyphosphatase [Rhizobiales bacterium]|nr:exopolyphosphatase [Hyphomicrobiales bacterium]MBA68713.1 exopolyphosphatase [Hyphomicrobiales bacterium]|tara:strand:- start:84 stop:1610 length:1527 start_codon:yes stop_codon:yes gene_type:complete
MIDTEAHGRAPGSYPVSVVDIGSNSVRLVIYEALNRSPSVLFNEKVLCGLGKGLASGNRMDEEAISRAINALRRFRALSDQARAREIHVLATAAAREAENGPAFIEAAEDVLGCEIRVLTGVEEARFSALGIISGFHNPDGIAGDLGGGSLELVDVRGRDYSGGVTLPLGGLRLSELSGGSIAKARTIARSHLKKAEVLKGGEGRTFYSVGGTWRNIAKLHMEMTGYPLHMMQAYEIPLDEALEFLARVARMKPNRDEELKKISRNRRALLPFGAVALQELMEIMKPEKVSFSALGVREGYLYSLLPEEDAVKDPLLAASSVLANLRARSPIHARELAEWTGDVFKVFGIEETENDARYRQAACLLADISWRAHPDYRGLQALNIIAHSTLSGISHAGRAYIALANYYRFEGLNDDGSSRSLATIATPRYVEFAKLLGGLLRVVYLCSASMDGVIPRLKFERAEPDDDNAEIYFVLPRDMANFLGERVEGRLGQLSKLTGKKLAIRMG